MVTFKFSTILWYNHLPINDPNYEYWITSIVSYPAAHSKGIGVVIYIQRLNAESLSNDFMNSEIKNNIGGYSLT